MAESKSAALPLGDAPAKFFSYVFQRISQICHLVILQSEINTQQYTRAYAPSFSIGRLLSEG
jgi:hypothetical protein